MPNIPFRNTIDAQPTVAADREAVERAIDAFNLRSRDYAVANSSNEAYAIARVVAARQALLDLYLVAAGGGTETKVIGNDPSVRTLTPDGRSPATVPPSPFPLRADDPRRDWVEDFEHENGQYFCLCHICKAQFVGHKRRVVCALCAAGRSTSEGDRTGAVERTKLDAIVPPSRPAGERSWHEEAKAQSCVRCGHPIGDAAFMFVGVNGGEWSHATCPAASRPEAERLAAWCDAAAVTERRDTWGRSSYAEYFGHIAALLRQQAAALAALKSTERTGR